jgi:SPP1 gp7 family putative phage head morphogenesis protein
VPVLPDQFWDDEQRSLFQTLLPFVLAAATDGATNAIDQIGIDVDMTLVNTDVVAWARQYTFDLVNGITETSKTFLQQAIATWAESGQALPALIEQLSSTFGNMRAEMIAVTEVTRAYAAGNQIAWQESGVVEGMRWQTARDELVCEICAPLHGEVLALDSEDIPPAHVRCRCWVQPVVNV